MQYATHLKPLKTPLPPEHRWAYTLAIRELISILWPHLAQLHAFYADEIGIDEPTQYDKQEANDTSSGNITQ